MNLKLLFALAAGVGALVRLGPQPQLKKVQSLAFWSFRCRPARLAPLRKNLSDLRRKSAAPKKAASSGGWATVSSQSKSRGGARTASRGKASRSGGAFAALGD